MDEIRLGKCGFYCGCCPTYIKGGACNQFPWDTIITKPHTTILDKDWMRWKKESNIN